MLTAAACLFVVLGVLVPPARALAALPAPAQSVAPVFRALGSTQPFRAEIITEVMLDRIGFMWIGTREGLFLYDGQRFRQFQHEVQDPDSISSNGIRGVFEDSRGRLWVNTISGGLNLLDRGTWRFRSWRHERNDPHSLSHDGVFALAEAPGGKLWVGTQAGLDLFDPASGEFEHRVLATGGEFVIALRVDAAGRLWVGTLGQGLFRQSQDGASFDPVRGQAGRAPLDVFALERDGADGLWVGARDGLYRVTFDSLRITPVAQDLPSAGAELRNVTALKATATGGLWVGTFGDGLYWRGAHAPHLEPVPLGPPGPGARQIDGGALALDRDGSLLVGTFGAGLLRASPRIAGLQVWQAAAEGGTGLSYQDVYALVPAPNASGGEDLLVGSFGGGIDRIDGATGAVSHEPLPVADAMARQLSGVTDLLRTTTGVLWASTNEGMYRWDPQAGRFHYFPPDASGPGHANPGYSFAVFEDSRARVWVGSAGGGLYLYLPASDSFRRFRPRPHDSASLGDDFVTDILEDRRGRLWVGTRSGGISICRYDDDLRCQHLGAGTGPDQLSHDHVTAMLEAPDGSIWVATAGGGLDRVFLDGAGQVRSVRRWSRDDGLVDDNVMGLVYAADGMLWLATHGGLSRLDPASGRITNITPRDGLPTAVFNPKAAVRFGGRLVFGSAKGVVALGEAQTLRHGPPPPTVIESITGLDAASLVTTPAWQLDALRVPWRTPFSLEFAVLGYDGGAAQFQYRLAAADAWINLGDRGQLTLHALAPGQYALEVRGRRGGHGWTMAPGMALEIVPPWWRRPLVQAGAVVLALLLLFAGFYWRVRELEIRNRELQTAHDLRAEALAEAHDTRDRLTGAFVMLRQISRSREAAKEDERKHLARELHDEFGQSLTTAKINLGLALTQTPAADVAGRIRDTVGVIERLIGQVRALSLNLRPPLLDEVGLVAALDSYLHAVSERSDLAVSIDLDADLAHLDADLAITVFRLVQEAITNVLRHARAESVAVTLKRRPDGVAIRVADDGRGFDPATLDAATPSGLGLFGMRERVYALEGEWSVETRPGAGTVIKAFIPTAGEGDARHSG